MKNTKKTSTILTTALMLSAAAFAAEDGAVAEKQSSLLQKLDSLNQSILGLRLSGTAKAGGLTSMASSDQFVDDAGTQENQAYTDVNLKFLAQPSAETRINVQLRLHKDWQSAYEENNNPAIGHWFSYDGSILNKHVDFNLGYMRVGYTPLTINTPQVEILQEPEIFAQNRVDALAYRNLDTTSRRLMQGLNVVYNSGSVGALDNIFAQATGTRMRNTAKKNDQVFFDFDWSDRYAYGLRAGAELLGANLGVNFVNIFDRRLSTRSRDISAADTLLYDDNSVLSVELGFDSKQLMPNLPVNFGLNGEFAMSWWDVDREYMTTTYSTDYAIKEFSYPVGDAPTTLVYVSSYAKKSDERVTEDYMEEDGIAFNVQPYVEGSISGFNFKLNGMYLQNDEKFWSDLASSPAYTNNTVILNSNALYNNVDENLIASFSSGNLENLYFSVYNSNVLNASNLMTSGSATVLSANYTESSYLYNRLFNNFKLAHFYRNGYDANSMKKLEAAETMLLMDPSVNLALPYGLATPDRKGFAVSLDADWNEAISLNVRFSQYNQDAADNKYTTIGAGVGVNVGLLVPSLSRDIKVQGSFESASEDAFLKRSTQRIVAGFNADIWGPIALQAGFQMLTKKFEADLGFGVEGLPVGSAFVQKVDEMLILAGPRIRIAPESYLTVRYGLLNNSVDYTSLVVDEAGNVGFAPATLSIDKSLVTAEVIVNF